MGKSKLQRLISLALVMLFVSLVMIGCSNSKDPAAGDNPQSVDTDTGKKPKVAVIVMTLQGSEYENLLAADAKLAAEKYGAEVVSVSAPKSFGDYAEQVNMMEDMLNRDIDMIMLSPSHEEALIDVVKQAREKGIAVVHIDTRTREKVAITEVYSSHEDIGYKSAKMLFETLGGKGNVVYIEGEAGNPACLQRMAGMKKALAEYPDIKIVASQNGHWTHEGGLKVTENAIQANPQIDAVCAADDNMALGAVQALESAGLDIPVASINGSTAEYKAILEGKILCTVRQNTDIMGGLAARYGMAYLKYFKDANPQDFDDSNGNLAMPFPLMIATEGELITKENAQEALDITLEKLESLNIK